MKLGVTTKARLDGGAEQIGKLGNRAEADLVLVSHPCETLTLEKGGEK